MTTGQLTDDICFSHEWWIYRFIEFLDFGEKLGCFDFGKISILVKSLGDELITNIEVYLYICLDIPEKL